MRSLLYVPANSARFLAKAHERGADCVILDLEDSVADTAKTAAREGLAAAVAQVRQGPSQVAVRVNAGDGDDLHAAVRAGADLIVVPKCDTPGAIALVDAGLRALGSEIPVLALIESPGGVLAAADIARHPRLMGLATGSEDLARSLGAEPLPEVLRIPKLLVHYAAKAAGKHSFGLLRSIADYADLDGIADAARQARAHGFDGATCVHPSAVAILNAAFAPSSQAVDWAQRVLAAATDGTGAAVVDGRMIDRPVIDRARDILARSGKPTGA